jgi:phosphoribosylanthranilate isomerase
MTVKVKICGLRTEADIDAASRSGADYIGLVVFPNSPRHVEIDRARELARYARAQGTARIVVLLVDPSDHLIDQVMERIAPDVVQLHGEETVSRVQDVRRKTDRAVWKAVPVMSKDDVTVALDYYAPGEAADVLLFDAKAPQGAAAPGGNGLAFDWRILSAVGRDVPFALAGGMTAENVAQAVALTGPAIVDVSSGVERSRGVKDPERIRRFILAAKADKQT